MDMGRWHGMRPRTFLEDLVQCGWEKVLNKIVLDFLQRRNDSKTPFLVLKFHNLFHIIRLPLGCGRRFFVVPRRR